MALDSESVDLSDTESQSTLSLRPDPLKYIEDYYNNASDLGKNVINTALRSEQDNEVKQQLFGAVAKSVGKGLFTKTRLAVTVPQILNSSEIKILEELYPNFNINFSNQEQNGHAFAAASRILEHQTLLEMIGYNPDINYTLVNSRLHTYFVDIGGNFPTYLKKQQTFVHCCSPIMNAMDSNRFNNRAASVLRDSSNRIITSPDYMNMLKDIDSVFTGKTSSSRTVCRLPCHKCPIKAYFGISLHSIYDIPLHEIATMMVKKDMLQLCGTFIYSDAMLNSTKGYIPNLDVHWQIVDDRIDFVFKNDDAYTYSHNFKDYIKLVLLPAFQSKDKKTTCFVELLQNSSGIQYFRINRAIKEAPDCIIHRHLHFRTYEGYKQITLKMFDYDTIADYFQNFTSVLMGSDFKPNKEYVMGIKGIFEGKFQKSYSQYDIRYVRNDDGTIAVSFFIETSLCEASFSWALAVTETKFRPLEIFNYLRQHSTKQFHGKEIIRRFRDIDPLKLFHLAFAIYQQVFDEKFRQGQFNGRALDDIKQDRDLADSGLMYKLFRGTWFAVKSNLSLVKSRRDWPTIKAPFLDRLNMYMYNKLKRGFDTKVLIQDPPKCVSLPFKLRTGKQQKFEFCFPKDSDTVLGFNIREYIGDLFNYAFPAECDGVDIKNEPYFKEYLDYKGDILQCITRLPQERYPAIFDLRNTRNGVTSPNLVSDYLPILKRAKRKDKLMFTLEFSDLRQVKSFSYLMAFVGSCEISKVKGVYLFVLSVGEGCDIFKEFAAFMRIHSPICKVEPNLRVHENKIEMEYFSLEKSFLLFELGSILKDPKIREQVRDIENQLFEEFPNNEIQLTIRDCGYEEIIPEKYANRSAAKLDQMIDPDTHYDSVLDICAYPGGFSDLLNNRSKKYHVVSGKGEGMLEPIYLSEKVIDFSFDDLDLTKADARSKLLAVLEKYDLVLADGSVPHKNFEDLESENINLFCGEVYLALNSLKLKGTFVMKVFSMYSNRSLCLLALLVSRFANVSMVKPRYSRQTNGERYLVCKGFLGLETGDDRLLEFIEKEKRVVLYGDIWKDYVKTFSGSMTYFDTEHYKALLQVKEALEADRNKKVYNALSQFAAAGSVSELDLDETGEDIASLASEDDTSSISAMSIIEPPGQFQTQSALEEDSGTVVLESGPVTVEVEVGQNLENELKLEIEIPPPGEFMDSGDNDDGNNIVSESLPKKEDKHHIDFDYVIPELDSIVKTLTNENQVVADTLKKYEELIEKNKKLLEECRSIGTANFSTFMMPVKTTLIINNNNTEIVNNTNIENCSSIPTLDEKKNFSVSDAVNETLIKPMSIFETGQSNSINTSVVSPDKLIMPINSKTASASLRPSFPDIEYVDEDLFKLNVPAIAHCVSADFKMSAGIAVMFKNIYRNKYVNPIVDKHHPCIYAFKSGNKFIINVITKNLYYEKPTRSDFINAIADLFSFCFEKQIKQLAIPKIGSGKDKLPWNFVEKTIRENIFDKDLKLIISQYVPKMRTDAQKPNDDVDLSTTRARLPKMRTDIQKPEDDVDLSTTRVFDNSRLKESKDFWGRPLSGQTISEYSIVSKSDKLREEEKFFEPTDLPTKEKSIPALMDLNVDKPPSLVEEEHSKSLGDEDETMSNHSDLTPTASVKKCSGVPVGDVRGYIKDGDIVIYTDFQKEKFHLARTPGDGYCLYTAATRNGLHGLKIRNHLLAVAAKLKETNRDLLDELSGKELGGTASLAFIARLFSVNFKILDFDNSVVHSIGDNGKTFYLKYESGHYDALVKFCSSCTPIQASFINETSSKVNEYKYIYSALRSDAKLSNVYGDFSVETFADNSSCYQCVVRANLAVSKSDFVVLPRDVELPADFIGNEYIIYDVLNSTSHFLLKRKTRSTGKSYDTGVLVKEIKNLMHHLKDCNHSVVPKEKSFTTSGLVLTGCENLLGGKLNKVYYHEPECEVDQKIVIYLDENNVVYRSNDSIMIGVEVDPISLNMTNPGHIEVLCEKLFKDTLKSSDKVSVCQKADINICNILALIKVGTIYIFRDKTSGFIERADSTFVKEDNNYSAISNSCQEIKAIWRRTADEADAHMKSPHLAASELRSGYKSQSIVTTLDTSFCCFNTVTGSWTVEPKEDLTDYSYCYYNEKGKHGFLCVKGLLKGKVLDLREFKKVADKTLKFCPMFISFSKSTKVMLENEMYDIVSTVPVIPNNTNFKVSVVEGVPGAGKTQYIVDNHDKSENLNTVVLTATREAAKDLRCRVLNITDNQYEDLPKRKRKFLEKKYRTVESLLLNYKQYASNEVQILFVDEALMKHVGQIFWIAILLGIRKLILCGDTAQICYFNNEGYKHIKHTFKHRVDYDHKYLTVSRRCPCDAVEFMNTITDVNKEKVYQCVISTLNPIEKSLSAKKISGLIQIQNETMTQYLTFTRAEKFTLSEKGYKVNTIGEFQGKQAKSVVLVRLSVTDNAAYSDRHQMVVAVSRHTESFRYFTVVQDELYRVILDMEKRDGQTFRKNLQKIRGGGFVPNTSFGKNPRFFPHLADFEQFCDYGVILRPDYVKNLTKEETTMRNICYAQDYTGYVQEKPYIFDTTDTTLLASEPENWAISTSSEVEIIQDFVNRVKPGCSLMERRYDNVIFESDDFYFTAVDFITSEIETIPKQRDYLTPVLRTPCPTAASTTQKQVIKAFNERNGGVPDISGRTFGTPTVDRMLDRFKKTYVRDIELFNTYKENTMSVNIDSITEWLKAQPPSVLKTLTLEENFSIFEKDLHKYFYMLKRIAKPVLDDDPETKYPSPQAIAYQDKLINSVFCPMVRDAKQRLYAVLKKDKIMYSDMSPEVFEKMLSYRFPPWVYRQKFNHTLEIDFSKYDKSQHLLALMFEIKMMEELGFPEELILAWLLMHIKSTLVCPQVRFKAFVEYQRKSGDAMTFFGNTMFLMAVMANLLDISGAFCLFSGDDSFIFHYRPFVDPNFCNLAAAIFNLEAKILNFSYVYFCSKFIIPLNDLNWAVIPDLWKVCIKLGRYDMVSSEHVEEYRISLVDNLKGYARPYNTEDFGDAVRDRYSLDFNPYLVFHAIYNLINNKEKFANLFYLHPCDVLSKVNTLPSFDI